MRPHDIESLRIRLRAEAERQGAAGLVPHAGDGWVAHVEDHAVQP